MEFQEIIKAGFHKMIVILKSTVAVKFRIFPFLNNMSSTIYFQIRVKFCAESILNTMVRPHKLWCSVSGDGFAHFPSVVGSKSFMICRMPVLRQHNLIIMIFLHNEINIGNNLIRFWYGKGTSFTKIILDVDNDECFFH